MKYKNESFISSEFMKDLVRWSGNRYATLCNSYSSANLIALSSLTSPLLGSKRLERGDEVITTTLSLSIINAIIQVGCVPVFVDIGASTYNTSHHMVSSAISEKTKAIFLPHILGNPYDTVSIRELATSNELYMIEGCCQSFGARFRNDLTGSLGDISTGFLGGGIIFTNVSILHEIIYSFCHSDTEFGHIGYELGIADAQALSGHQTLNQVATSADESRKSWEYLHTKLDKLSSVFILPEYLDGANPYWYGFPITLRDSTRYTRDGFIAHLDECGIMSNPITPVNVTTSPTYANVGWRVADMLPKSNQAIANAFYVGYLPKISTEMMDYISDSIYGYIDSA